jgi:hypothetical protein
MLALFLQSCTHWKPVALEPAELPTTSQVRATLHTGQQVIVKSPVISGDTLREASTGGVRWSRPLPRSGIPLAQINRLEVQEVDGGATAGVVILTGVAVGAITLLVLAKSWRDAWRDSYYCSKTGCDH